MSINPTVQAVIKRAYAGTNNMNVVYQKTRAIRGDQEHGIEEIYYRTSINIESLHLLAKRAARNKQRKAWDGPLLVEVLEINKLERV